MKWITCQNSSSEGKYFNGRLCYEEMLVDDDAAAGTCWKCVALMVPIETKKINTGYPRGWKFMTEFVDKDGHVFHKGIEQADLFNTLPPSDIKEAKKREKKRDTLEEKTLEEMAKRIAKQKKTKTKVSTKKG